MGDRANGHFFLVGVNDVENAIITCSEAVFIGVVSQFFGVVRPGLFG